MSVKEVVESLKTCLRVVSAVDDFKASNLQEALFKEAEKQAIGAIFFGH